MWFSVVTKDENLWLCCTNLFLNHGVYCHNENIIYQGKKMGKGSNYIFLIKICESFAYTLHNLIYVVHLSVNSVTDSFLFLEGSTTLKGPTLRQIYRRKYNKLKENVKKNGLGHFFFFFCCTTGQREH